MGAARFSLSGETLARFLFPGRDVHITAARIRRYENDERIDLQLAVEGAAIPEGDALQIIEPVYDDQSEKGLPPRLVALSGDEVARANQAPGNSRDSQNSPTQRR